MFLLILFVTIGRAEPPSLPASLCDPGTTAFTCETTRGKVASVCASPDLTRESGWMQYRFGRPGAIELAVPAIGGTDETSSGDRFDLSTLLDEDDLHQTCGLGFSNGNARYMVYGVWLEADSDRKVMQGAGIWVHVDGKLIAEIPCARWHGSFTHLALDWVIADHPKVPPK